MKKNKTHFIFIITFLLYLISISIYELFFCNSNWIENGGNYQFSVIRFIVYSVFMGALLIFRKYFTKDLEKVNSNKIKKIIILGYSIMATLGILVLTIFLFTKNVPLPRMAMLYIAIIMGEIALVYVSNNYIKNVIIFTFTLAICMVPTVDINNRMDEARHFFTAYNISLGNFNYQKKSMIDRNFLKIEHETRFTNISDLFESGYQADIGEQTDTADLARMPTDYNFFTYLSSAFGIFIARLFSGSMADIYFTGRLFNLITFMILIILALKLLPYKKSVFFVIATMPMTFLMSTVYSADMVCIGIIFVFISYCLNLYHREHIDLKHIIILILMLVLLWIPKSMSYIFVAFVVLILPIKKMIRENKKYIPYLTLLLIAVCGFLLYIAVNQNVPDDPRGGNTGKIEQIHYLKEHPIHIVKVGINHICSTLIDFDWLGQLHASYFFGENSKNVFLLMLVYILFVSLIDTSKNFEIKAKIIFLLGFLINFIATSAILYLVFTPIGDITVKGYQTRYILPILPLLLMTISNHLVCVKKQENMPLWISSVSGAFLMIGLIENIMII